MVFYGDGNILLFWHQHLSWHDNLLWFSISGCLWWRGLVCHGGLNSCCSADWQTVVELWDMPGALQGPKSPSLLAHLLPKVSCQLYSCWEPFCNLSNLQTTINFTFTRCISITDKFFHYKSNGGGGSAQHMSNVQSRTSKTINQVYGLCRIFV